MKNESNNKPNFRITKTQQVKKHLLKKKSITSWEAIELYKATRLSAIIFTLRNKDKWKIETKSISARDVNGNTTNFAKYVFIEKP
jgi:hypothetical protein